MFLLRAPPVFNPCFHCRPNAQARRFGSITFGLRCLKRLRKKPSDFGVQPLFVRRQAQKSKRLHDPVKACEQSGRRRNPVNGFTRFPCVRPVTPEVVDVALSGGSAEKSASFTRGRKPPGVDRQICAQRATSTRKISGW